MTTRGFLMYISILVLVFAIQTRTSQITPRYPEKLSGELPKAQFYKVTDVPSSNMVVVVQLTVKEDGSVSDAKIAKGASPELDKLALDSVKTWKYTPTRINGDIMSVIFTVTLVFEPQ